MLNTLCEFTNPFFRLIAFVNSAEISIHTHHTRRPTSFATAFHVFPHFHPIESPRFRWLWVYWLCKG